MLATTRARPLGIAVALITLLPLPAHAQQDGAGFPDLVGGIMAVEGALGVQTGTMDDGKQVIFAWFEDKAAALRWYYSDMHRGVQDAFFPNRPARVPLEHIADGTGPILAIASITFDQSSAGAGPRFTQIAIELYQPLPGGLSIGGTFAPAKMKVPGMVAVGGTGGN